MGGWGDLLYLYMAPFVALVTLQALVGTVDIPQTDRTLCVFLTFRRGTSIVVRFLKIRNRFNF